MCEIDIGNLKTRNSRKGFRYETFYYLFELKVFRYEERETQSFDADCFYICPKSRAAPHLQTTGQASAGPESQPSRSDAGTQLSAFSQIPQILSSRFWCMTSFTPPGLFSIWGFILTSVNDASSPRARKHLRSCLHLTNQCTEPKGSHPN